MHDIRLFCKGFGMSDMRACYLRKLSRVTVSARRSKELPGLSMDQISS